jgi:hypothetical protein
MTCFSFLFLRFHNRAPRGTELYVAQLPVLEYCTIEKDGTNASHHVLRLLFTILSP